MYDPQMKTASVWAQFYYIYLNYFHDYRTVRFYNDYETEDYEPDVTSCLTV